MLLFLFVRFQFNISLTTNSDHISVYSDGQTHFVIYPSRSTSAAAVSSPLHPPAAPGVCGHVAGGPAGERAGLRDGGGVHQHCHRYRARTTERGSESSAPPGTQSTGEAVWCSAEMFNDLFIYFLIRKQR